MNSDGAPTGAQRLAGALLRDAERIAEGSAVRIRELLPPYAGVPLDGLTQVTLANVRNLLRTIRQPARGQVLAANVYRVSGESCARHGISSDQLLKAWRIGLDTMREEARAAAEAPELGTRALLEFIDALLRVSDIATRSSASAHHETEIRELGRLTREQAALRRVATMVAGDSTSEEVFATVAKEVAVLLGADAAAIQRYEPAGVATVMGNWGSMEHEFPAGSRLTLDGEGITPLIYRTERPGRFDDYEHASGRLAAGAQSAGLRSAIGYPIFVDGRLWGAIVAGAPKTQPVIQGAGGRGSGIWALGGNWDPQ